MKGRHEIDIRTYSGASRAEANDAYEADIASAAAAGWTPSRLAWDRQQTTPTLLVEYIRDPDFQPERVLRADELIMDGRFLSSVKGWLLLTDRRLVFAMHPELGKTDRWSVPLDRIVSVVTREHQGFGMHKLTVHFRDDEGAVRKQDFLHANISKGLLLGPFSHVGDNPLTGLEGLITQQVAKAVRGGEQPSGASPAATMSGLASELERLADLHERGALSDDEYAAAKARLIDGG